MLDGAFGLLDAVEQAGEAGLTRLAADCGLPKTTAYRLLEQLVTLGALERCATGYRTGPRLFRLGHAWEPHPRLRDAARGPVRRLAEATGATVALGVLREGRTLVLNWTPGDPGAPTPLGDQISWPWYTAAGKVLVAGMPPDFPLGSVPASWRREAADIRDRGAAFEREELIEGVSCVAVPVFGGQGGAVRSGTPVAALCLLTDPAHRLDRLADAARLGARAITTRLRAR